MSTIREVIYLFKDVPVFTTDIADYTDYYQLKKKDLTRNRARGILQDNKEYTLGGDQIV